MRPAAGCFSAGPSPVTNWTSPIHLPQQPAVAHSGGAGTESRVDVSHSFDKKERKLRETRLIELFRSHFPISVSLSLSLNDAHPERGGAVFNETMCAGTRGGADRFNCRDLLWSSSTRAVMGCGWFEWNEETEAAAQKHLWPSGTWAPSLMAAANFELRAWHPLCCTRETLV